MTRAGARRLRRGMRRRPSDALVLRLLEPEILTAANGSASSLFASSRFSANPSCRQMLGRSGERRPGGKRREIEEHGEARRWSDAADSSHLFEGEAPRSFPASDGDSLTSRVVFKEAAGRSKTKAGRGDETGAAVREERDACCLDLLYHTEYNDDLAIVEREREERSPRLSDGFLSRHINAEQRRLMVAFMLHLGVSAIAGEIDRKGKVR